MKVRLQYFTRQVVWCWRKNVHSPGQLCSLHRFLWTRGPWQPCEGFRHLRLLFFAPPPHEWEHLLNEDHGPNPSVAETRANDNWLVRYRSKIILHVKPIPSKKNSNDASCRLNLFLYRICKPGRSKRDLHLQFFLGHFISWASGPAHGFPPFAGGGLLHFRVLFLFDFPQNRHTDHEDHSDIPPSTATYNATRFSKSLLSLHLWVVLD